MFVKTKEIINNMIIFLQQLKKKGKEIKVKANEEMQEIWCQANGETYAVKKVYIEITYNQLYKKNTNNIFDFYKPNKTKKGESKKCSSVINVEK